MNASPDLSVVVPTHDTRELTLACLSSLAADGGDMAESVETIVVDDGSRDGTAGAVAQHFPRVRLLRNERPEGFSAAANRGLSAAAGKILLLLNSDTEVLRGSLPALLDAFDADPGLSVAGGSLRYPDGRPQWSGGSAPTLPWLFALASGLPAVAGRFAVWRRLRSPRGARGGPVDWVTGAALAVRREVWERHGPLDESFGFYGQDLDLCWRIRRHGGRVAVLAGFVVVHHHGATIGRVRGASRDRQHPKLLWGDLLRWARKARGTTWARWARRALRWGSGLRIALRTVALPFIPAPLRQAFRRETAAYRQARSAL